MTSHSPDNSRRDADAGKQPADAAPSGAGAGAARVPGSGSPPGGLPPGVPSEIDGYKLLHVIGSGGMATVYAAMQERPRRTVALKVMRAEVDDDIAVRRFRREVEILGKLRHQYIAQVFSAGTYNDGEHARPYFAMEYVRDARTIFEYAAMENLTVRQRVKLFVHVCAALEHGHRNRIVHRDLKPGNILVDRRGRPKIIDFGVARVSEMQVGVDTMNTEMGRLVGTIQYMSPEQVAAEVASLDGRCDVYGLGVVLCKLLTGKPPYELEGLPVYEAARVIREDQPERPSVFNAQLKGDLDTIILKALEKEPARRYPSAGEFGRDLMRWLENKPIHARPAAIVYRARLFFARHRAALISTLVSSVVVVASSGVVLFVLMNETQLQQDLQNQLDTLMKERSGAQDQLVDQATESDEQRARRAEATRVLPPVSFLDSPAGAVPTLVFDTQRFGVGGPSGGALDVVTRLITGTAGHDVVVWDISAREPVLTISEHDSSITHVAAGGGVIASASADGSIAVDNADTGVFIARHSIGCDALRAMTLDDDATLLAWSCDDLAVHVRGIGHDDASGQSTRMLRSTRGQLQAVSFSPDATRVAGGSERGSVFIWDPNTGRQLARMDDLDQPIIGMTFDAAGVHVIAAASDGRIAVWRLRAAGSDQTDVRAELVTIVQGFADGADSFACNHSRSFAALTHGQRVQRFDLRDLSESVAMVGAVTVMYADIETLAISDDGRVMIGSHADGRMSVHHVRSEQ